MKMKRYYWGFNWNINPLFGQFGLFKLYDDGYRYYGFGCFFSLFALFFWMIFSKEDSDYVNLYPEEKSKLK